jgi:phosphatidylglycerol:prolipoprotein diacylglycerol transferase
MHPVLFRIGSIPLNSYGLALAVSFLLGVRLASRRCAARGIPPDDVTNMGVWVMMAAIVGSRALYVITHLDEFANSPIRIVAFWNGLYGLSMLGGVVLATAVGFAFIARKKWPAWELADAVIPAFPLGIFITRIGCFLNGCCFGSPTDCPLGVSFPPGSLPWDVYGGAHLHPAQLYASAAGLYMLLALLLAGRRRHFPGFIFSLFLGLYGATRFGLEEFRHFDHQPYGLLGFSVFAGRPGITDNQLVSLLMIAGSLILGIWLRLRRRKGF